MRRPDMTATTLPCSGGHDDRYHDAEPRIVDLPCGCTDAYYPDGTVCWAHNHDTCNAEEKR